MIYKFEIPEDVFKQLKKDVEETKISYHKDLAGNIREEYSLNKFKKKYENFLIEKATESKTFSENLNKIDILYPNNQTLTLGNLWVNFQKKHEFNPIHNHSGVFSFILFIKIPFLIDEELQSAPGIKSNLNLAGHLQFIGLDTYSKGGLITENLGVDKNWEQSGLIFRSYFNHCVYPFYSSDDYRITVSGNVYLSNQKCEDIIKK